MIIAGMIGLAIIALASVRPDIAIIGWLTVSLLVPHWTPIPVGLVFQPSSALAIPVVLGVLIGRIGKPAQFKLNYIDYSVAAAALIVLVQWYVGDLPFVFLKDLIFLWMLAYILGRFAVENTRTAIVVLLSIIAAWGLLEFAFGWHVFENWYPSANHKFNEIQERAGVARSEASIGHAIAYGAVLAMGIPFAQRSGRKAIWIQLLLCAGIIVSLSRGPMLTMVLTLVLTVWVLAESKVRVRYTALALAGSLGVYYVLTALYSGAYSDEVRGSGDQRVNQLDAVGNAVHWMSTAITGNVNGQAVAGNVGIIDSTPLRLAVNFGIIAAVLFIVPILVAAIRSLNRKAGPASVALAGQIPVLVVTSLILQWQVLAFFMMGMVATEISARRVSPPMETTESETTTPVRKSYANRAG
ncbi:hypothetical protein [Rhodococcus globerulus]|uniref:hypothetical protein n=1 Tax=Rhodococcus globerulus TaxID=33008 RepID=UPI0030168B2A